MFLKLCCFIECSLRWNVFVVSCFIYVNLFALVYIRLNWWLLLLLLYLWLLYFLHLSILLLYYLRLLLILLWYSWVAFINLWVPIRWLCICHSALMNVWIRTVIALFSRRWKRRICTELRLSRRIIPRFLNSALNNMLTMWC